MRLEGRFGNNTLKGTEVFAWASEACQSIPYVFRRRCVSFL